MENIIPILIYIHAFFGGIGLITGLGSTILKKGSKNHKLMGKLFSIGMLVSSMISIPIALMPKHKNPFLLLIGIFTIYMVLTGNRALKFKTSNLKTIAIDKSISLLMLLISIGMLLYGLYGIIYSNMLFVLYLFFGGIGLLLSLKDFKFYKNPNAKKNAILRAHTSKMIGALIASITAFIVAGLNISNIAAWIIPSIIGTIYIIYWKKKLTTSFKL